MAWIYSLSAECGSAHTAAENFVNHFDHTELALSLGRRSVCKTSLQQEDEGIWWGVVVPVGLSRGYPNHNYDERIAQVSREICAFLYDHLKGVPSFRYALVGCEVDEFRTFTELVTEDSEMIKRLAGLVIQHDIWQRLSRPSWFEPFAPGYLWLPYEEENWSPC